MTICSKPATKKDTGTMKTKTSQKELKAIIKSLLDCCAIHRAQTPTEDLQSDIRRAMIAIGERGEIKPVTFNKEQNIFVIPEGDGYSCLGLDICRERSRKLALELKLSTPDEMTLEPMPLYERYVELLKVAMDKHKRTGWRSSSELIPELVGHEGKKVTVKHQRKSGEIEEATFTVGKSIGFVPIHLMIKSGKGNYHAPACFGKILSVKLL